ncbi:hypothetical protein BDN70DRAFT_998917 [Pholiota conissans]|uniref:F-box domain-containing protein n=1 Tax=Pholiota conissans TaxID=109636 RepID=A0A9P5YMF0_9AGAR|nr:hypothetical protein BDN70DRAFT_998917 [Pholiota conissans]
MSSDYLSSLPEEMLDEISKFIQRVYTSDPLFPQNDLEAKKSYRALAQTCKSFRAHFQRRLFSNIDLSDETRLRKLAELVQNNPVLASYIRMIDLKVDHMCMDFLQYSPLLAIMHAASSSGTTPKICLQIGIFWRFSHLLQNDLPSNMITHLLNAPQTILHAITNLQCGNIEPAYPVGLFKLFPNLRLVGGYNFVVSSNDCLAEDHTSGSQFFRPKLDVLVLDYCTLATIKMLCEEILDLSALKICEVNFVKTGNTGMVHLNAKRLLAWGILDHAPSVQTLQLDVGVGPFYNLSRLQHLRRCTFNLEVHASANPVPHLCQLLRTLPPLPEHNLEYLRLSFEFIDILFDENDIASSHILFSIGTWSTFDAALINLIASGTRPFKLKLVFRTPTPNDVAKPSLKSLFVDWERKYLPKSSQQRNLTVDIQHSDPCFYSQ